MMLNPLTLLQLFVCEPVLSSIGLKSPPSMFLRPGVNAQRTNKQARAQMRQINFVDLSDNSLKCYADCQLFRTIWKFRNQLRKLYHFPILFCGRNTPLYTTRSIFRSGVCQNGFYFNRNHFDISRIWFLICHK